MTANVFITGISGYIATELCRVLQSQDWCENIFGIDIAQPRENFSKVKFRKMDINDAGLAEWIAESGARHFVHLTFIVDPHHDEDFMERVNIDGTRNALAAAAKAGVDHVVVASSGTAYGAWPDNPVPLAETDPIRPHPTFKYANDKSRVESICSEFKKDHPEIALAIIRPCVVYGPGVNNYLSNLLTGLPVVVGPKNFDPPLQFVHERDVAGVLAEILRRKATGPFNIAPQDTISLRQAIGLTGKPKLFIGDFLLEKIAAAAWKLHLPLLKAPASVLDFMRYPWILDNTRSREELGYDYKFSTRQTVLEMLAAKGVIKSEK